MTFDMSRYASVRSGPPERGSPCAIGYAAKESIHPCWKCPSRERPFAPVIRDSIASSIRVRRCAPRIPRFGEVRVGRIVVRALTRGEPVALGRVVASSRADGKEAG
jgi:hypothetical protein